MGEKGNTLGGSAAGAALIASTASSSLIEKVSDTATSAVVGVGQDFLEVVKDKSIGAVADNTVTAAREHLQRKDKGTSGATVNPGSDAVADDGAAGSGAGGAGAAGTGAAPDSDQA